MIVDTSVFIDGIFRYDEHRSGMATHFFKAIQNANIVIKVPEIFKIELIGQLARRIDRKEALETYSAIIERVEVVSTDNLREVAFSVALDTGCRAIDAYFIAAAKLTDSILITNDKTMVKNARDCNIEVYYLVEEFDRAISRLRELKAPD